MNSRPVFLIAVPRTLHLIELCLRNLPRGSGVQIIENGLTSDERGFLSREFPTVRRFKLRPLPGQLYSHGSVVTFLARTLERPFLILDHDCFPADDDLLQGLEPGSKDVAVGLALEGFVDVNSKTGLRFPRTHFLLLEPSRLRALMARHEIHLDKYTATPNSVANLLATIGIGDHNFPRPYQANYDTLLLAFAVAIAEGKSIQLRETSATAIHHVGGTSWVRHPHMDFVHLRLLELTRDPEAHARALGLEGRSSDRAREALPPEVRASRLVQEVDRAAEMLKQKLH
ncbi:MAG: hypothetical protein HY791_01720 [Deltaproteobacteria bacterium]|nr:hypothetical protein [Deltaproteobacteria bacterium]